MDVKRVLKRNSSTILTCIGAAGVIFTAVTAVNITPAAPIQVRMVELFRFNTRLISISFIPSNIENKKRKAWRSDELSKQRYHLRYYIRITLLLSLIICVVNFAKIKESYMDSIL